MNRAAKDFIWGFVVALIGAALVWAMFETAPQGCDGPVVEERRCVD